MQSHKCPEISLSWDGVKHSLLKDFFLRDYPDFQYVNVYDQNKSMDYFTSSLSGSIYKPPSSFAGSKLKRFFGKNG